MHKGKDSLKVGANRRVQRRQRAAEGCTNFVRAKGEEPLPGVSHELRSRIGRALNTAAGGATPYGINLNIS